MRLLHGGKSPIRLANGLQIFISPPNQPPLVPEKMVFEENTNLVLTVDQTMTYEQEHPIRTMTDILHVQHHKPGSVIKKHKN